MDISEEQVEHVVRAFYARIREDAILGPIFAEIIIGDWEPHLQKMMAFWSSVVRKSGRYNGNPMQKHMALTHLVKPEHFAHWLVLFGETVRDVCTAEVAAEFEDRAQRIAASLKLGMFGFEHPGEIPARPAPQ